MAKKAELEIQQSVSTLNGSLLSMHLVKVRSAFECVWAAIEAFV